jgi:primosomal protein DnaI
MEKLNNNKIFNKKVDDDLKKEYLAALRDESFDKFVKNINLNPDILMKYTTKLQTCCSEFLNCSKCLKLEDCKNEIYGFKLDYSIDYNKLKFDYKACKYKLKEIEESNKDIYLYELPKSIKTAKMKDIFINDKNRKDIIIWLKNFVKNYDDKKYQKGLYLHGNFGCGKTYLIAAAINELNKNNVKSIFIHFSEFIRDLKSFDEDFKGKIEKVKRIKILVIDDIGSESVTPWNRDEILGPILQYRMDNELTTFFTSNLSLENLETHLSVSNNKVDLLKAKRIIERIKKLTFEMEMNSVNLRN